MKAIINGKIIKENKIINDQAIIFNNRIIDFIPMQEFRNKNPEFEIIDAEGNFVSPGLIDIHIHGSGGSDTMDGTLNALKIISKTIVKNGVTSFLPTTMTMAKTRIYKALLAIREAQSTKMPGASVLGAHMEGPFINKIFKGAQSEEHILLPDFDFISAFTDVIKIITLAPETDKDFNFIKQVSKFRNITLSLGHTNATYEECIKAISLGISHATHTFNAMTPLSHRKLGAVGAIFKSNISCELIADNIHVHPDLFDLLIKIKGDDKVVLITDAMRAGSMKNGEYDLGGQKVIVKDASARLQDGTLAGSVLSLNIAIKNILQHTELSLPQAIKLASLNPAKVLNLQDEIGSLEIGKKSDIIIIDKDINVIKTFISGECTLV